ncbi:hypothetical protein ZIOFF_022803 [Zingiber officinale]|uniref:Uncharacterized protein n=1 Tax=Zingiber officinale TaxID=94328 RepID=A0A8J5HM82_ZINOF|nr:hypothetical protein ZIOFF_022803 [Zingiber officinale]
MAGSASHCSKYLIFHLTLVSYEKRKALRKDEIGNIATLLIGSTIGVISSSPTFPLEVARKHMQKLGITALYIKLHATRCNKTKTPGPSAKYALKVLARAGMKVGRIVNIIVVKGELEACLGTPQATGFVGSLPMEEFFQPNNILLEIQKILENAKNAHSVHDELLNYMNEKKKQTLRACGGMKQDFCFLDVDEDKEDV